MVLKNIIAFFLTGIFLILFVIVDSKRQVDEMKLRREMIERGELEDSNHKRHKRRR